VHLLARFQTEVSDRGGEACLPRNLSDEWLLLVANSADVFFHEMEVGDDEEGSDSPPAPGTSAVAIAAVLTILRAKNGMPDSLELGVDELGRYLTEYRAELAFEEVHRFADVMYERASLETILTNRSVRTWRVPPPDAHRRAEDSRSK
jgi:hypothetical protein